MTSQNLESIVFNYLNGHGAETRRLLNKYSKNKQQAMENVLEVYEHLRGNYGQNTATNFSVFVRT